jgi:hypothetical protein
VEEFLFTVVSKRKAPKNGTVHLAPNSDWNAKMLIV